MQNKKKNVYNKIVYIGLTKNLFQFFHKISFMKNCLFFLTLYIDSGYVCTNTHIETDILDIYPGEMSENVQLLTVKNNS